MNDSHHKPASTKLCPLCNKDNQCALSAGQSIEHCWCQSSSISSQALSRIPASAKGRQCLCPQCGSPQGVKYER
ncbi:cysteine-rich CWC family protein [Parahaliea sp. F7430]|uniref:Cysteine-rich CWC family protein n=1 Tax=Sediminihaliea albiluteola TaxID=2758564 RepID=A0A7W2YK65_9GAMM|nr:cysteine-rich CWC family protein [Sediminihaliea albiluteola]